MVRPDTFQQPFIAVHNVPYICGGDPSAGHAAGGVLRRGQTVWTKDYEVVKTSSKNIVGFVEGVGVISISPRALKRADILNDRSA